MRKVQEDDVMWKAPTLPISKEGNQGILDLLIDPLCPLSLKKVKGVEMKEQMSLRLMRLSIYILKSTKNSLEHSKRV